MSEDILTYSFKTKEIHDKYFEMAKALGISFRLFGGFGNRFVLQQIGVSDRQCYIILSSLIAQMSGR